MKILSSFLLALALPGAAWAQSAEPADTVTVFMIGDSTMANKPLDKENQERGWGQMLPMYLEGAIKVDNHAVNGRSSKSFIEEGRWAKVVEKIRPGDFVIIQFGHNDEKIKSPDRYTVPGGSFDDNLRRFVRESREKGATPVLMNSIARRNFPYGGIHAEQTDDRQKTWKSGFEKYPQEGDTLIDTHGAYLVSPRNVAEAEGVVFIDLNTLTHNLVQGLGKDRSKDMFMWVPAGVYEFCPNGKIDNTHLNVLGGILVSRLAAQELAAKVEGLRPYVRRTVYNRNH